MPHIIHVVLSAVLTASAYALQLDTGSQASIKSAASTIAGGLYQYHNPSSTAGQFNQPEPWQWWLSGAGWTALIDYTTYTNDTTYISDIHSALSQNVGSNYDFVPAEQSGWEANDDQVYWVYSALTAMEYGFPALPCEASVNDTLGNCTNSWYAVAAHAFEDFVERWNNNSVTCNGGLKWQFQATGNGYTYKNTVANGGFFQTAARLARYSGNQTYADWATKIWDWSVTVGLIGADYHVFDGTSDGDGANCSSVDHDEWSYNIAAYLHGAANMYAYTEGDTTWETIVHGLVETANTTFFTPFANSTGIVYEQMCEKQAACSTDQSAFKGSLTQWMAKSGVLVPSVSQEITALLASSAQGAASSCANNGTCGTKYYVDEYDGQTGFGQELSALDAVLSLLVTNAPKLATLD